MGVLSSLFRGTSRQPSSSAEVGRTVTQDRRSNLRSTWKGLATWFGVAAISTIGFGITQKTWSGFFQYASAGLLLAAASASVGGLLGFLFGIPRSLQGDAKPSAPPAPAPGPKPNPAQGAAAGAGTPDPSPSPAAPEAQRAVAGLAVNTNLEQISDWLTKILVGVGLTNIRELGQRLHAIAVVAAPPLGGSVEIALFTMISFSIWGFFAAYLLTRLFLAGAFILADNFQEERETLLRHERAAFTLAAQGRHSSAMHQYAAALDLARTPEDRQRLSEGFVHNSLYAPPPDGFTQAINAAEMYLRQPGNLPSGKIWAYLAAALGQKYLAARQAGATEPDLASIENDALKAVRQALALDPSTKPMLHALWDPADPGRASPDDNDLEVFFGKPSFTELLGN
jgi:hypothetical protein